VLTPNSQFSETVDEPLLLHHGQVAFPARAAVVIPHGPAHLFVVHLLAAVGLHQAPRPRELEGVAHLEDAVSVADPADDTRVVVAVVEQVPDENVERGERNFGGVLPRPAPLALDAALSHWLWT
jgi:hypothetical protein